MTSRLLCLIASTILAFSLVRGRAEKLYDPLCRSVHKKVQLSDHTYEYSLDHYVEVSCELNSNTNPNFLTADTQMCYIPGFECVDIKKEMQFGRRNKLKGVDDWEVTTLNVGVDCQCMLPRIV